MLLRRKYYNTKGRYTSSKPVIVVGNLCLGGSGKTPHVEYLIRMLSDKYSLATMSRGYGRRTKGFLLANSLSTVYDLGDEPLSYYKKYPAITVSVCEDRVKGIKTLLEKLPDTDVIIMDDAYQHLPLKAGLSILLTDYYNIYPKDKVFPAGKLRESKSAANEADIIVITKTPKVMTRLDEEFLVEQINPLPHQKVYFSYIEFGQLIPLTPVAAEIPLSTIKSIVSLTGIANPYPLTEYLSVYFEKQHIICSDHHIFTPKDIAQVKSALDKLLTYNKAVITTEKDAVRLMSTELYEQIKDLPLFYLPIEVRMHAKYKEKFENQILEYVRGHK